MRERPTLGTPFGTDGPWLNAIVDTLADLYDLLDARLPAAGGAAGVRVVPVAEPAPAGLPAVVVPVTEPAPDETPAPEDQDEPAAGLPGPPPRAGRGSGVDVWLDWARVAGVAVPVGASRADVIALCEAAGVLPVE